MFVCPECGATQPMPGHCGVDGALLAAAGDDYLLGQTIGPYRVARLLGVGGMGRVYKGVQPAIGSRVAIKVLSRECTDRKDLVDRFFSEAKAVNLIRHESIVNVLDLATLPDGRPYIIMEYLDGAPLASIVDSIATRGQLPLGGLAHLAAEVLDALGAAHAKAIVHRDLKPDNIFVTPAGRPKVLDFGIAKLLPEMGGSYTQTGSLLGTPHYMAPEQAAGRPVDYRADLYAMGVILFECSTGQKPFQGESLFDLLRKHVDAPPPFPRSMRPDMPPALELVILTALAKAPDQRFASAQAMSMALQQATAQLPPEQWTPITAATASGAMPSQGGATWSSTPASWSSTASRSGHASQASQPGRTPGHPTTVSGQVGAAPAKKSRAGLWIGLGALVLIGGGITAAVVATGGGHGGAGASTTTTASTATAPVVGGGGGGTAAATSPKAPTSPTIPSTTLTPATVAKPAELATDPGDGDPAVLQQMEQMYASLDNGLKNVPPQIRAAYDLPTLHAHMRAIAKLPPLERGKAMQALGDEISAAAKKSSTAMQTDTTSYVPPSDGWIAYHAIAPPANYDPKAVDTEVFIPWAIAQAKQMFPDAQLFRIDIGAAFPDGHVDLTLVQNADIDLRFISPSHNKKDPSIPIGVEQKYKCMFRIMAQADGVHAMPIDGWNCDDEQILPAPHCSVVGVWKKAIAMKAPSGNAIAELGYRAPKGGAGVWFFNVKGAFSERLADDCR